MPVLTHDEIMKRRFRCDDGIWRSVWKHIKAQSRTVNGRMAVDPAKYIMILPNPKTGKTEFRNIANVNWFYNRESEEI